MLLPRFVAFKSKRNGKYLRFVHEDGEVRTHLQFSEDNLVTPFTKFELQASKRGSDLLHIRCCYNNKYLVRRLITETWLVANADEPEEANDKWSCTLFRPIFITNDAKTIRLHHVNMGNYCSPAVSSAYKDCLFVGLNGSDHDVDPFIIVDLESLVILPKHIAFKGDNGCYLSTKGHHDLEFSSDKIVDLSVWNEVFITNDGNTCIKSMARQNFWRWSSKNWIRAKIKDGEHPNTLFSAVRVDANTVGLRNLGNNFFCSRSTSKGRRNNRLRAALPTLAIEARFKFEELVNSREICDVVYKLADARMYGRQIVIMACGEAINSTDETKTVSVKLLYEDVQTSSWSSTASTKMDVKTALRTQVPKVEDGAIESGEVFDGSYKWGCPLISTNSMEKTQIVTVLPKSKVAVILMATKVCYDIPFSYTHCDSLIHGEKATYPLQDGIFGGVNYCNYEVKKEEKPLAS